MRYRLPYHRLTDRGGSLQIRRHDTRTVHQGHRQFSIRWTLPVDEDGAFERQMVTADLPGVHIPHIARELSVYFALRDVEEWAEQTLVAAAPR
jgi:hypothetical protein